MSDEIDRLIDCAAEDLVRQEPSSALAFRVMARIQTNESRSGRPVLSTAFAAALAIVAAAVAIIVYRSSTPAPATSGVVAKGRLHVEATVEQGPQPEAINAEPAVQANRRVAETVPAQPGTRSKPSVAPLAPDELLDMIPPITIEPVQAPTPLDPPAPVQIEALRIDPIVIN